MTKFNQMMEKHLKTLEVYVPVVERVHGSSHPEFYDVRKVYGQIISKIAADESSKPDLANEFTELRKITSNYSIPEDVCESYAAVYNMLKDLDEAY